MLLSDNEMLGTKPHPASVKPPVTVKVRWNPSLFLVREGFIYPKVSFHLLLVVREIVVDDEVVDLLQVFEALGIARLWERQPKMVHLFDVLWKLGVGIGVVNLLQIQGTTAGMKDFDCSFDINRFIDKLMQFMKTKSPVGRRFAKGLSFFSLEEAKALGETNSCFLEPLSRSCYVIIFLRRLGN